MNSFSLFDWVMLGLGAYVLYGGIVGKGRLYSMENVKEGMEEKLKKLMRWTYVAMGIFMMINAGATIIKTTFYTVEEVTPATESAKAVYEWVSTKDLGSFRFLTPTLLDVISYIFLGLSMISIVGLIVAIRKMTDKNAPRKSGNPEQDAAAARQAGHVLPVSAFEFDEPAAEPESKPEEQA